MATESEVSNTGGQVIASNRFIPTPFAWRKKPKIAKLFLQGGYDYLGRWQTLIDDAHLNLDGGKLTASTGEALDEYTWATCLDDVESWKLFLACCEEIGLLVRDKRGTWKIVDWDDWYRAPSQMPENKRLAKQVERSDDKIGKLQEQLATMAQKLKREQDKNRAKPPPGDQLELEETEERSDRIPDEKKTERDSDSPPAADTEERTDRAPLSQDEECRDVSQDVSSRRETSQHRYTCRDTCISRDRTNKPPEREERIRERPPDRAGSVGSVTLDMNMFWNSSDDPEYFLFWNGIRTLHKKLTRDEDERDWRGTFLKHFREALETASELSHKDWILVTRFCINETHARIRDESIKPEHKPRQPWGYSCSLLKEYAPIIAERKRRGVPVGKKFVRLNTLQADRMMLAHG